MQKDRGFTLIELLIVVAIIGILAVIAIPNLLNALHRSRQKRTMADMRSVAVAWEMRATDAARYNAAGAMSVLATCDEPIDHASLSQMLVPTYAKVLPQFDGWRNPLRFRAEYPVNDVDASSAYLVWAAAKDGLFSATAANAGGATTNFNDDIIFSRGMFLQYPDGVQAQ